MMADGGIWSFDIFSNIHGEISKTEWETSGKKLKRTASAYDEHAVTFHACYDHSEVDVIEKLEVHISESFPHPCSCVPWHVQMQNAHMSIEYHSNYRTKCSHSVIEEVIKLSKGL